MSTEVDVERVRMVLAEAGWPDALVVLHDGKIGIGVGLPDAVVWTAFRVAGIHTACWSCWRKNRSHGGNAECGCMGCRCYFHVDCAHPNGPARPPRELLIRSQ